MRELTLARSQQHPSGGGVLSANGVSQQTHAASTDDCADCSWVPSKSVEPVVGDKMELPDAENSAETFAVEGVDRGACGSTWCSHGSLPYRRIGPTDLLLGRTLKGKNTSRRTLVKVSKRFFR